MATLINFPKPAGPSHRQRSRHTIVAARRAGSFPSQRGTYSPGSVAGTKRSTTRDPVDGESGRHYSTSSGCPGAASHEPDADGDNRSAVPGQATVANQALALTGESTPLAGWDAGIYSRPLQQSDRDRQTVVTGAAATFFFWLGQRPIPVRGGARFSRQHRWGIRNRPTPARAIFIPRHHLLTASLVCFAVAGVVLAMEILR